MSCPDRCMPMGHRGMGLDLVHEHLQSGPTAAQNLL